MDKPITPPNGRYLVNMNINGRWQTVLEKRINNKVGTNHLPVFGLRYVDIPFMDFDISSTKSEVIFKYKNGVIVDRLYKIGKDKWLGKLFYKDKFIDYFYLIRKEGS